MKATILLGDMLQHIRSIADESVHCIVTSPPYWGLRDYKIPPTAWRDGWVGCFGLEPTPDLYIAHAVEVFGELRRVLRKDGTLWVNIGDSMANDGKWGGATGGKHAVGLHGEPIGRLRTNTRLKPKDMVGIPWRLAFALQADGWWLRQDLIWAKPNPMPESVIDRCTKAHEYVFLLSKSAKYFYDAHAIKERALGTSHDRGAGTNPKAKATGRNSRQVNDRDPAHLASPNPKQNESFSGAVNNLVEWRNKRSVWTIATQPYPEAHFATFPEELVEPCIAAGTSEHGCCSICGAPQKRILEPTPEYAKYLGPGRSMVDHIDDLANGYSAKLKVSAEYITKGWRPTCGHTGALPIPALTLDPFCGSGTVGNVALRMGRDFVGIELNPGYVELAVRRISEAGLLFHTVEVGSGDTSVVLSTDEPSFPDSTTGN